MKPNWYFDIEATGSVDQTGMGSAAMRNRLLSILHPFFSRSPGTYAIALPKDRQKIRVFASTRDELDQLAAYLQPHPWIRDYARLNYPAAVPPNHSGKWYAYCRYRIPSDKSDRKTGEEHGQLRQRRLKKTLDDRMEYLIQRSRSTGQSFSFFIQRLEGEAPTEACRPNSYGFSVSSRPFCLPDIP